jgi:phasin
MDMNTKATPAKPAGSQKADAARAFRDIAEKSTTQNKETYEKMSAATTEAAGIMTSTYSAAIKGVQDYNNKFIEFAHVNTNAAFEFVQKLSGVKSPLEFVEISTEHARKQLEALTDQAKQLAALAQETTLATAEPLKKGVAKAVDHPV